MRLLDGSAPAPAVATPDAASPCHARSIASFTASHAVIDFLPDFTILSPTPCLPFSPDSLLFLAIADAVLCL